MTGLKVKEEKQELSGLVPCQCQGKKSVLSMI